VQHFGGFYSGGKKARKKADKGKIAADISNLILYADNLGKDLEGKFAGNEPARVRTVDGISRIINK
jgi:hypothetical protein